MKEKMPDVLKAGGDGASNHVEKRQLPILFSEVRSG